MVLDLPHVFYVDLQGEDDPSRPTSVSINFDSDHGRGTEEVATIMRLAGWRFDGATFSPRNRLRFVECDQHE